ncbi:hypothetical protein TKK_0004910 [Trichogramma kaykai]|uniref:Peptidase S1 domain-containing protein n=1 Tax=Trichogramma kaykai TaxID=54128 RepID=A0ABD2XHZ8_9HYME
MKVLQAAILIFSIISITTAGKLRITDGDKAKVGAYPYQAYLRSQSFRNNEDELFCGATIISDRILLTAAHCISRAIINSTKLDMEVVVGVTNRDEPEAMAVYKVQDFRMHEHYDHIGDFPIATNDIGLIRVDRPIEFNDKVQPIQLSTETPKAGSLITSTGWGFTLEDKNAAQRHLNEVKLMVVDKDICNKKWSRLNITIPENLICVAGQNKGDHSEDRKGLCSGDSGSSNVHNGRLVGVSSAVHFCGDSYDYPQLLSDVYHHRSWIETNIDRPGHKTFLQAIISNVSGKH